MYGSPLLAKNTMSFTLILVVTDKTAYGGERIILKKHFTCFVQLVLLKKTDSHWDVGINRTTLLTLGNLALKTAVRLIHYM